MADLPPLTSEQGDKVQIPLVFDPPQELLTRYATNFVIQCLDHEFVLSFYEAESPILLGSSEENLAELRRIGEVHARCVARIVVAPVRMQEFARLVADSMARFEARKGENPE